MSDEPILIARCPEHGLHGSRETCFECGRRVEQVMMVEVESEYPRCEECGGTGRYPESEYNKRVFKTVGTICTGCNGSGTRFDLPKVLVRAALAVREEPNLEPQHEGGETQDAEHQGGQVRPDQRAKGAQLGWVDRAGGQVVDRVRRGGSHDSGVPRPGSGDGSGVVEAGVRVDGPSAAAREYNRLVKALVAVRGDIFDVNTAASGSTRGDVALAENGDSDG